MKKILLLLSILIVLIGGISFAFLLNKSGNVNNSEPVPIEVQVATSSAIASPSATINSTIIRRVSPVPTVSTPTQNIQQPTGNTQNAPQQGSQNNQQSTTVNNQQPQPQVVQEPSSEPGIIIPIPPVNLPLDLPILEGIL